MKQILFSKGNKFAIIGSGGFAREVMTYLLDVRFSDIDPFYADFYVSDEYWQENRRHIIHTDDYSQVDFPEKKLSEITLEHNVIVAIGDPKVRQKIVEAHPELNYVTLIASDDFYPGNEIGVGCVICPGTIVTANVKIGNHVQLNLQTTVGHDSILSDFATTAPGAKISGNCNLGKRVYVGTNASIKEKIDICADAVIGLNAGVVKNIVEAGTYVGTPATKVKKYQVTCSK